MHITIIGANGQIGRRLVQRLAAHDDATVRAVVRSEDQRDDLEALGAEVVLGDLEGEIAHALEGTDAVVFTAGSGPDTGPDKTLLVDLWGARRVTDEAVRQGVRRLVLVSSMGTRDPLQGPDGLRPYLVAKRAADDHLRATDLDWTIVRPGMLTDDAGIGEVALSPQLEPGRIPRDDVAEILAACVLDGQAVHRTFEATTGSDRVGDALTALG